MNADKLAETISRLSENGHWEVIVTQELIDALADDLEKGNYSPQNRSWHGHLGEHKNCTRCHPFNRAKWTAKAKGESC